MVLLKILITGGNGNIAKIIKNNLKEYYDFYSPSHNELDVLNYNKLNDYINNIKPDIIIHTAILGGRRTIEETSDVVYKNLLMFKLRKLDKNNIYKLLKTKYQIVPIEKNLFSIAIQKWDEELKI